jgi:hypothetical protein
MNAFLSATRANERQHYYVQYTATQNLANPHLHWPIVIIAALLLRIISNCA